MGNAMDQPLKSPGLSALDNAFHAMVDASRAEPAPTVDQRIERLTRLRAAIADNEARFEAVISADFGHRDDDRRDAVRNLEIPGSMLRIAPE
jgi:coniferyl-aldehyde dehydrogenase